MMKRAGLRVMLLVSLPLLAVGVGCSLVAGVDFSKATEAQSQSSTAGEGGQEDDSGGLVATPDTTPTGCAANQKTCSGACVSSTDPAYGCGATDCLPCSVSFATAVTCKAGACAADGCAPGRGDCDNETRNGCEASLSSPASCGACGTKCEGATPLCAPTGCASSCPVGLTECNGACIDTKTSLDHCGTCGRTCASPTNGDAVCLNSTCAFSCRSGFGDCVNNPATACSALPKWYRDQDGDGVGSAVSVQACAAPAGHTASSGDCLDSNAQVFPGQAAFFPASFVNAAGLESYDYNCSGVEEESGGDHWPGSCGPDCENFGNTPKSPLRPAAAGQDVYCGSTSYRSCYYSGGGGSSGPIPLGPYCTPTLTASAAITCR